MQYSDIFNIFKIQFTNHSHAVITSANKVAFALVCWLVCL